MTTTIVRWGNSQGIRLPKFLLESVNLTDSDVVEVTTENGSIVIKKSLSSRPTIQELFKDYDGTYEPIEIDWGKPVGKEIW